MSEALVQALPRESILHYYLQAQSIIEPPVSFDLLCGLSVLSVALKRNCWVDQVSWKVYPATSVMLVGPSGVGKSTAINKASEMLEPLGVRVVKGLTSEALVDSALRCGTPASGMIIAGELADLLGKKDYQQGIVQTLTDLLDCKETKDIALKSGMDRIIRQPTFGVMAASTADWLHTALPKDSMSGGFYGRFMVVAERKPKREVSLVKRLPPAEVATAVRARDDYLTSVLAVRDAFAGLGELPVDDDAAEAYEQWYRARHDIFGALATDYATRSRDHVLRTAMICALTCMRSRITLPDMQFALEVINHIAKGIDVVVAAASPERTLADKMLTVLPASESALILQFSRGYAPRLIKDALGLLRDCGQAEWDQVTRQIRQRE